jgi:hypothetical protein
VAAILDLDDLEILDLDDDPILDLEPTGPWTITTGVATDSATSEVHTIDISTGISASYPATFEMSGPGTVTVFGYVNGDGLFLSQEFEAGSSSFWPSATPFDAGDAIHLEMTYVGAGPLTFSMSLKMTGDHAPVTLEWVAVPEPPGAHSPTWGAGTRLHVWLALKAGNTFTLDDPIYGRLGSGNIVAAGVGFPRIVADELDPPGLWFDVSCHVLSVETERGATTAKGPFVEAEAGTAVVVLADPDRDWDPADPRYPRFEPGCPVMVWCEVRQSLGPGVWAIVRRNLFVGTINSITEPWSNHRSARQCTIIASDGIADLVKRERPELAVPEELVHERLARIVDYYGGPTLLPATSGVMLQATTLSGSAWEAIKRTVEAEVGFAYVTPYPADPLSGLFLSTLIGLRFLPRETWADDTVSPKNLPCGIIVATSVRASDDQRYTRVTAGRDGDTEHHDVTRSVVARREIGLKKTDLALTDAGLAPWAEFVLAAFQARWTSSLTGVTLRPAAQPDTWVDVTGVDLLDERITISWQPDPDTDGGLFPPTIIVTARVIGIRHSITRARWEVSFNLADATQIVAE